MVLKLKLYTESVSGTGWWIRKRKASSSTAFPLKENKVYENFSRKGTLKSTVFEGLEIPEETNKLICGKQFEIPLPGTYKRNYEVPQGPQIGDQ